MAEKRKRVVVTMQKKLEAINRLDKGESVKNISIEYGVGAATVCDWKKNRSQIEDFCAKMVSKDSLGNRSTIKKPKNESLDEALLMWFEQQRERGVPISGPILKEKALSLNQKLGGDPSFTASIGWLSRWKDRHGVRQLTITGESLSGAVLDAEEFKKKFEKIVKDEKLSPAQIYNADETGLNYKMLPTKTLASKLDEAARGHKKNKERVTLLVCSNASGTHKLPLVLIGKSTNPRALKNVKRSALPLHYASEKSAWMSSNIFKDWFFHHFVPAVKIFLTKEGLPLKAILLIDNAPTHPGADELKYGDIRVQFLPANVTALIQPMDQGAIETLKRLYRRKLLSKIIDNDEDEEPNDIISTLKQITIKDVIYMTAAAWEEETAVALNKTWRKLWPNVPTTVSQNENEPDVPVECSDENFVSLLNSLVGGSEIQINDIAEWIQGDEEPHPILSEDDIVAACSSHQAGELSSDDDDGPSLQEKKGPNHSEATRMFEDLMVYLEQQEETSPAELLLIKRLRDRAAKKRSSHMKQKKISHFFTSSI